MCMHLIVDSQVRKSRSLAAASSLSDPFGRFEAVERKLSSWVGLHPYAADVVLTHARTALDAHRTLAWLQGQPVSTQDLQSVRALYARGVRLLMEVQATALPPRPLRSEALQPLPLSPTVSLPVTRRLAEAQAELAALDGQLARALREHTSVAAAAVERRAIADPAQRFLAETEPKAPPTLQTLGVRYCEEAIALGASALALSAAHPPLAASAAAAMGAGHLIIGLASGKLDRAWDVNPAAPVLGRRASASNVNAGAGNLGNKTPAGGKASNKDAPPPPPPPLPPLPPTEPLACSEQGLCVAVEEGVKAENWEAVRKASAALVQIYAANRYVAVKCSAYMRQRTQGEVECHPS